jgi:hypothetical protein
MMIAVKVDNVKVTHAIVAILWCLDHASRDARSACARSMAFANTQ